MKKGVMKLYEQNINLTLTLYEFYKNFTFLYEEPALLNKNPENNQYLKIL